ncbi:MAG: hypothetical protein KQJ78_00220 [Deltaproteobacteria bacterium]|nr:hypothetical protein [Deltaproteobacteria bacterium]
MGAWQEISGQIRALDPSHAECRKLGLTFLVILGLLAGLLFWKGSVWWPWFAGAAGLTGGLGLLWPRGLTPLYLVWMSLAAVLGYFMSRLLLTLVFYLVLTPVSLVARLVGKDFLDLKMGDRESYWHRRDPASYRPEQSDKLH